GHSEILWFLSPLLPAVLSGERKTARTYIKQHTTTHSLPASDTVERLTSHTKPTSAFLMSSSPRAASCSAFQPPPPTISINCLKRCRFLVVVL
ncbi:hypothetical protein AMECASPLE_033542, partial [Ameca splendens]